MARWIDAVLLRPGTGTAPNSRTETTSPGWANVAELHAAPALARAACSISRRLRKALGMFQDVPFANDIGLNAIGNLGCWLCRGAERCEEFGADACQPLRLEIARSRKIIC